VLPWTCTTRTPAAPGLDPDGRPGLGAHAHPIIRCRVIGGHMVTVLGARWRLGREFYRETGDVDLGITPIVARDHHVVGRLRDLDYAQVAGNRFARGLSDIPVKMKDKEDSPRRESAVDRPPRSILCRQNLSREELPGGHRAQGSEVPAEIASADQPQGGSRNGLRLPGDAVLSVPEVC